MVPVQYALMPALPLTANGKRDVNLLRSMLLERVDFDIYKAPKTEVEIELCRLWRSILQQERISINSNFFELGGHSILAMQLIASINTAFSIELQVVSLFENNTVKRLAELVEDSQVAEETGWL
jgi:acyl carrier protein